MNNPHDRCDDDRYSDHQALLDLAAIHNLLLQVGGWAQGDSRRKAAHAKLTLAHERLIDLVGQS